MTQVADFNLEKSQKTLDKFLLTKGLNTAPTMQVLLAVDISVSMSDIIRSGKLQSTINQMLPVALKFDDNGELDVFKFDTSCDYVGTMDKDNYSDFVRAKGIAVRGGTSYAPIVKKALQFAYGNLATQAISAVTEKVGGFLGMFKKPAATPSAAPVASHKGEQPVLVIVATDGECNDARETEEALVAAQAHNVYFHFVGIGGATFNTIKYLADKLPNVGDVYLRDFGMTDEEVYAKLITDELVGFIRA